MVVCVVGSLNLEFNGPRRCGRGAPPSVYIIRPRSRQLDLYISDYKRHCVSRC